MNSDDIRKWLLRNPRPESVRIEHGDDTTDMPLEGKNVRWRDVAESIEALEPVAIHAMRGGQLLRAMRFEAPQPESQPEQSPAKGQAIPGAELPAVLQGDPQAALLALYATEIAKAYSHATGTAFEKFVQIQELMVRRMEALETRLERAEKERNRERDERLEDAWDWVERQAEETGSSKEEMLGAFLSSFVAGNKATNGKASA